MLRRLRHSQQARKHERALADLKSSAASLASSVAGMVPAGHCLSMEQIDRAAANLARDFLSETRLFWLADGMSPSMIDAVGPVVATAFTSEFKTHLCAAVSQNLIVKGSA